jgi:hypothetical protein
MYINPGERYSSAEDIIGYEAGTISPKEDMVVKWQVSNDGSVWESLNLGKYHLVQSAASGIPLQVMAYNYFRIVTEGVPRYRELIITKSNEVESGVPAPSSTGQILGASGSDLNWSNTPDTVGMHFSWNGIGSKWIKNNYAATANPTAGDDSLDEYDVGSIWINTVTGRMFWCTDSTASAAVWQAGGFSKKSITIFIDGGPAAIVAGGKIWMRAPAALTINGWYVQADQAGDIVVDVKKAAFPIMPSVSIAAAAKPTLSSAANASDTTLTGWTTAVAAGDMLLFEIESAATVERVMIQLEVEIA